MGRGAIEHDGRGGLPRDSPAARTEGVDVSGHPGDMAWGTLRVARYNRTAGGRPADGSFHTMWQYTSTGPTAGDHNRCNGALDRVQALADG